MAIKAKIMKFQMKGNKAVNEKLGRFEVAGVMSGKAMGDVRSLANGMAVEGFLVDDISKGTKVSAKMARQRLIVTGVSRGMAKKNLYESR